MNLCSKPGCGGPGAAVLAYEYAAGSARLDDLPERPISPHLYVLCDRCATSLRAPRGWVLDDRRGRSAVVEARRPAEATVAPAGIDPAGQIEESAAPEPEPIGQRQLAFG